MGKYVFIFSLLACCLSIFLMLEVERLTPYQELVKSYLPKYARNAVESGIFFVRSKVFSSGKSKTSERIFSKSELSQYIGKDGSDIYLAVLGKVYDVTKGKKHYGPDGGYHGFAGRDGTRAFITGQFNEEGLVEDIKGLKLPDLLGLDGWQTFYEKDYKCIGKVEGEFYDWNGQPTENLKYYQEQLKLAKENQKKTEAETRRFPPCNSQWAQDTGTVLWCTNQSGGIERDWVGVPREFHEPGRQHMRCACVRTTGPPSDDPDLKDHKNRGDLDNPRFKVYAGCDPKAESCKIIQ
ncbi:neuferricin-like [Haliotis asinina]|uniref:neuferricin-like n=1 Tax=Haliotis asinina TaxID=109174 RepID=UPI0035320545